MSSVSHTQSIMLGNTLNLVSYTHHVFSQSSYSAVVEIYDYPATAKVLDIELAATIDAGKHFVQATYYLEGDGPLVFTCCERLSALAHAIAIKSYSNTEAKARQHAGRNMALYNQIVAQAKACINPGFRFYQQKFSAIP